MAQRIISWGKSGLVVVSDHNPPPPFIEWAVVIGINLGGELNDHSCDHLELILDNSGESLMKKMVIFLCWLIKKCVTLRH